MEATSQGSQDDIQKMGEAIPLKHTTKNFTPALYKGEDEAIFKGDSSLANASIAKGLVNAIILPQDKAK